MEPLTKCETMDVLYKKLCLQPLLSAPSSKPSIDVPKILNICAALAQRALAPRDASHDQIMTP